MPVVNVQMWEEVLDAEREAQVIAGITDVLAGAFGEQIREFVVVIVHGVPQHRWGNAGVPASVTRPVAAADA